ncbi:hypothetical protein [Flavobacterium sp.]|uniref:hypothetical protein n=1 Tax=Flavobacterium sp. TaxID=239 RepID=UPI0037502690
MNKSILTLAIVALTFSTINATEVTTTSNTLETSTSLSRDQITEVYDWQVTTNLGTYSGTSLSSEEAQKMITLVSTGEIILSKKVESFYQVKEEIANNKLRLYFWEVTTNSGSAKGFSSSESQAKRIIELVCAGDVLTYKIIQSADFDK